MFITALYKIAKKGNSPHYLIIGNPLIIGTEFNTYHINNMSDYEDHASKIISENTT